MTFIIDIDGNILWSDSKKNSLTCDDLVNKNIDAIVNSEDILHCLDCIKRAIQTGYEICSYGIKDHIFIAIIKRISSSRVKSTRKDVTGLTFESAMRMFL